MTKHVIELNGQKYDAKTGKPLVHSETTMRASSKIQAKTNGPKHVDGFTRRPGSVKLQPSTSSHKQVERSKTLMRAVVSKPVTNKVHAQASAPASTTSPKHQHTSPRVETIKPGRAIRANVIGQSDLISKFGKPVPDIKTAVIPVTHAPAPLLTHTQMPVVSTYAASGVSSSHTASHTKPDPFKTALESAISHEQPRAKKAPVHHRVARRLHVSPRLVSFAGVTIFALGIGGFLAYQNLPGIAMQVASTRAGLNASLPKYQPAGFSMAGPIEYEPGEITVNYKSNSDNRSFEVTQKNSAWNSETLLENHVSPSKQPYQTFQANGRTIYIYEDNKATWVDGGVWFNIDGKTNLNSDQLLRIAGSL